MIVLFFLFFFNAVDINKAFCMFICLLVRFMTNLLCALVFFCFSFFLYIFIFLLWLQVLPHRQLSSPR